MHGPPPTDADDLVLYHAVPSRSAVVRWMLEEVGHPYRLHLLDLRRGEHKAPAYLAVNPMGKVPALVHDGAVVTEAAAICCHLADAFPESRLAPPPGDPRRGPYLKWLFFGPGCLEPALADRAQGREGAPPGSVGHRDLDATLDVLADAVATGPYLLGALFTAADVVIGSGLRWAAMTGAIPPRPEVAAYVARLEARPALRQADALDAELAGAARAGG